ncbi:porin [Derxia lacustris]|uniref:porin n=1 Tax=Derxia lacustris TaxID=764842 RepID=UPI001F2E4053|nr:porin [Derxia lacustris]
MISMRARTLALALAAPAFALPLGAQAVEFKAGDWTLDLGGIVNAYYTSTSCSGTQVGGIALASKALGCGGTDGRTTIGNGLLPNALITSVKTTQDGVDIGATILIAVHTATSSAVAENNNVDVRRAFFTAGNAETGTFKIGRDGGVFGDAAIFGDMTLLGAGAAVQATQRGRVTLGHIGAGYSYLGYYGQLTYLSPSVNGFSVEGGVYSPVDGTATNSGKSPQAQLRGLYKFEGGKAWVAGKTQRFKSDGSTNAPDSFTMNAVEVGALGEIAGFGLMGNYQTGKGLGILSEGDSGKAKQHNWITQATYAITPKLKAGVSYGESKLKDGSGSDFEKNTNGTLGAYYKLTKSVTVVAEVGRTESKAFDGGKAKMNGGSVGAILFF